MSEEKQAYPKRIVLTLWTVLLWIVRSPTMLMLVVGFALGYYAGWQAGKASALPRAIRAEKALQELQTETAKAIAYAAQQQLIIRDDVRQSYEDARIQIHALDLRIADLRDGARVCDSTSTLPIPNPSTGTGSPSSSGQPRPADVVLQELAADIARRCDGTAAQLNGLIEWIERTRTEAGVVQDLGAEVDKQVRRQLQ